MTGLTERQEEVLRFIAAFQREHGFSPTLREIGKALGMASTNGVFEHLQALEKKGALAREPRIARTLRILGEVPGPREEPERSSAALAPEPGV